MNLWTQAQSSSSSTLGSSGSRTGSIAVRSRQLGRWGGVSETEKVQLGEGPRDKYLHHTAHSPHNNSIVGYKKVR